MIAVLLHNPGLLATLGLLLAGMLVSGLLAAMMAGSGTSLKGIVFFAVFFALVVLPQIVGHLAMAVKPPLPSQGGMQANAVDAARAAAGMVEFAVPVRGTEVRDPAQVFGADHDVGRRSDDRALFASRMPGLQVADAVHWPTGDSVTALVFGSADEATSGLMGYLGLYQVAPTLDRGGVEVQGARGLGGGLVRLRRSGASILAVTALSESALQARLAAMPLLKEPDNTVPPTGASAYAGEPLVPALQPLARLFREHVLLQIAGVLTAVVIAAWWFFAGTAWAARVPADSGVKPLAAASLKSRLLAVNQADVPIQVEQLPDGRIAISWRYADARFVDFTSAHRMVRTHRLVLRLDEAAHRVYSTEQSTELDARAGLSGATLRWRTELGMTFFQIDHRRVFGLQIGPDGRPTGDLSYAWRFNLNELKRPFIAAVAGAGWDWQPVMLDLHTLLERGAPAVSR